MGFTTMEVESNNLDIALVTPLPLSEEEEEVHGGNGGEAAAADEGAPGAGGPLGAPGGPPGAPGGPPGSPVGPAPGAAGAGGSPGAAHSFARVDPLPPCMIFFQVHIHIDHISSGFLHCAHFRMHALLPGAPGPPLHPDGSPRQLAPSSNQLNPCPSKLSPR